MEEEEEEVVHMPFGDTFGTRANYSQGMMYAGRRRFMDDQSDNALRPPKLFMTRPQSLRNAFLQATSSDKLSSLQNMAYFREEQNANANAQASKRKQLLKKKVVEKHVTVEMFSSLDPADWEEEFIAGCRMWTNHASGEVSVVCPWTALEGDDGAQEEKQRGQAQDAATEGEGTGAPVYDGAALEDLFATLDSFRSPKKQEGGEEDMAATV